MEKIFWIIRNFFGGKIKRKCVSEETETSGNRIKSDEQNLSIVFSEQVLNDFRQNVGRYTPETGGLLASSGNRNTIDHCYFDAFSKNTSGTFYYDIETMSAVYREWKSKGFITNGIYHSHPIGAIRPSYHDISTALLHIEFLNIEYFYLPIIQPKSNGQYKLYFYVVRLLGEKLTVKLEYVIKATSSDYIVENQSEWYMEYSVDELKEYRDSLNVHETVVVQKTTNESRDKLVHDYFEKVQMLYPEKVLEKVLVCVGTGGARSFLENMARSGFKNFLLIDADIICPSNIATQAVYISEMGMKKINAIRDCILDINPSANVHCIDRFLDDSLSDEEFKSFLELFPNKDPKDYLILGCTDNFHAQKRSSFLALKYGIPYLAAMMYEGGAAAEIIFVYPGVTESCPRCLLRDRFEKYENGFINDVDSAACPIFATERMNALKGYISLILLMYKEDPSNKYSNMLDDIKNRNFIEIRMDPYLSESKLGIGLFDKVLAGASRYIYMDETLWIPQHPDRPEFGESQCLLCGGTGHLEEFQAKWRDVDTRTINV